MDKLCKKDFARQLRKNMTDAEMILWRNLRKRQIHSFQFRRQYIVGPYVVDFICVSAKLIIECDGGQHCGNQHDQIRDEYLLSKGYRVLRFWNHDILGGLDSVLESIRLALVACPPPSSTNKLRLKSHSPPPREEGYQN